MNKKQREKIENSVDVIVNGYSKRNHFMTYLDAYEILKDYAATWDSLHDPKAKKRLGKIDFEVTEDTEAVINIIKILITSKNVRKEITRFKVLKESE